MTQIVIATHGLLANGLKQSTEFILGKQKNLHTVCGYTKACPEPTVEINAIIAKYKTEPIIFLTDIFGGSVNNYLEQVVVKNEKFFLICGVNLPLVIQLFNSLMNENIESAINESIEVSRKGVINCSEINLNSKKAEFDSF